MPSLTEADNLFGFPPNVGPAHTQVNAQGLLREVQAAEEGKKAGVGAQRIAYSCTVSSSIKARSLRAREG